MLSEQKTHLYRKGGKVIMKQFFHFPYGENLYWGLSVLWFCLFRPFLHSKKFEQDH